MRYPGDRIFYAEDVWLVLQSMARPLRPAMLDMERDLAAMADVVVVMAESEGALHELGAFSFDDRIVSKLLAIIPPTALGTGSFLELGPLARVNELSLLGPTITLQLSDRDVVAEAVCSRLTTNPLAASDRRWPSDELTAKQHLLLLCDILFAIGFASLSQCETILKDITEAPLPRHLATVLALGIALETISEKRNPSGESTYGIGPRYRQGIHVARAGRALPLMAARAASLGILTKLIHRDRS